MPDRMRPPRVSGHTLMAVYDGADPSVWNEGMIFAEGACDFDVTIILDAVVRQLVPVNLLMPVVMMALQGIGRMHWPLGACRGVRRRRPCQPIPVCLIAPSSEVYATPPVDWVTGELPSSGLILSEYDD